MSNMNRLFTIQELLVDDKDSRYIIPIYQRNYAWGATEIRQLIQDVFDYSTRSTSNQPYYIGSLVVYCKENNKYEVIDGQQRLTTLMLLLHAIKGNSHDVSDDKLIFESRDESTATLKALAAANNGNDLAMPPGYRAEIYNAHQSMGTLLDSVITDSNGKVGEKDRENFRKYLLECVKILRVQVPEDTNLNHYFEIMNTRGEQLEQHEIVKARCMEKIQDKENEKRVFSKIWDVCANMNTYVQQGFAVGIREKLFGNDYNKFMPENIQDILACMGGDSDAEEKDMSLKSILELDENKNNNNQSGGQKTDTEPQERFTGVINFPNFLLQVLSLFLSEENISKENISLDDKLLLQQFDSLLEKEAERRVLDFAYHLLRCKFLFDKYIIKRKTADGKDEWVLKQYKNSADNADNQSQPGIVSTFGDEDTNGDAESTKNNTSICMLLSMFHASSPSQTNKNWLRGALTFLHNEYNRNDNAITSEKYLTYLEGLAQAFLHDRALAADPIGYTEIIHNNAGRAKNNSTEIPNYLTGIPHFVFYYLDYLLWRRWRNMPEHPADMKNKFKFTVRDSIEHWSPQNPLPGNELPGDKDDKVLHDFGNLCLISGGDNSRLSNNSPNSKANHCLALPAISSLKQWIMADITVNGDDKGKWNSNKITKHAEEMKRVLFPDLGQNNEAKSNDLQ